MLNIEDLISRVYDECPKPIEETPNKDSIFEEETKTQLENLASTNKSLLEELAQVKAELANLSANKVEE